MFDSMPSPSIVRVYNYWQLWTTGASFVLRCRLAVRSILGIRLAGSTVFVLESVSEISLPVHFSIVRR